MKYTLVLTSMILLLATNALGQSKPATSVFRAELVRQLDDAEKKLLALAEVTPQEKYSWRPGKDVRSTGEVFLHVALGNLFIPEAAGFKPPAGLEPNLDKITDKQKIVDLLKRSFEHERQAFASTSDTDLDRTIKLFGAETTVRDLFLRGNACA